MNKVTDVQLYIGQRGAWCWAYKVGSRLVMQSNWKAKNRKEALAALDAHLAAQGLTR